jgi:hypothetical protein
VPFVGEKDAVFGELAALSRVIAITPTPVELMPKYARLQAVVARLYRLSHDDFEHVLGTFPLVSADARANALALFGNLL